MATMRKTTNSIAPRHDQFEARGTKRKHVEGNATAKKSEPKTAVSAPTREQPKDVVRQPRSQVVKVKNNRRNDEKSQIEPMIMHKGSNAKFREMAGPRKSSR